MRVSWAAWASTKAAIALTIALFGSTVSCPEIASTFQRPAFLDEDRRPFAAGEVAPVIGGEAGNLQRIEGTREVGGEAEQMLEALGLEHEIAQPPGLEVLLDVRREAAEESDKFREILGLHVRLQPDLEDADACPACPLRWSGT